MKHAYMIMAHNQEELLKVLLNKLDIEENDIIIHLDQKCNIQEKELEQSIKKASVYFADRVSVTWGGVSQIEAELKLMEKARSVGTHCYYHLLTGVDLPLKPIENINRFFEDNQDKEFINFSDKEECERQFNLRVKYYHFFRNKCGRSKNFFTIVNKIGIWIQKFMHKTSSFRKEEFVCGSAYWDITEDLVEYVLKQEKKIKMEYRYTSCCDEVFLHKIVWNSNFRNQLYVNCLGNGYKGNMRWIDMVHGQNAGPYIIQEKDIEEIISSGMLFARKFDIFKFPTAISKLMNRV